MDDIKALQCCAVGILPEGNEPFSFMKPGTLEWFIFRTSMLEPDDTEGIELWEDYLVDMKLKKRKERMKANG